MNIVKIIKWSIIGFAGFILFFIVVGIIFNPSTPPEQANPTIPPIPTYEFIEETGIAAKTINITNAWDANDIARTCFSAFVKFGQIAFKNTQIETALLECKAEFIDSRGNKSVETAIHLKMFRDKFQKYNWKNLEYRPIYHQLKNDCSNFYIHPGLEKDINPQKIFYVPSYQLK